jgi:hypothetical protein
MLAVAVGGLRWGWRGAVLGATLAVFWLLLQLSRTLRVLRQASTAPVGRVANAVMFQARLKPGLSLIHIVPMAGSLGLKREAEVGCECFEWMDASGDSVLVRLQNGRLKDWTLQRADTA